ncbi:hypothetical protein AB0E56_13010 [Microbacterium sp. NPDC028030]|uniref:hypothetical protein n=1 Tax=Microbacterium sp. NPDC028030 TaxID=3155124 RepID=UPI0033C7A56D
MADLMPLRYLDNVHPRSRWGVWAWSPVIVLRVALVGVYLGFVYASVIAFIAGVPVFRLTAPEGYTSVWAVLLGTSSVLAAVGSITDRWQQLEKWASLVLSAMMLAYVGGLNGVGFVEGDLDRQFVGAIAFIAFILPAVRFVYLAAQSGKRKHDRR